MSGVNDLDVIPKGKVAAMHKVYSDLKNEVDNPPVRSWTNLFRQRGQAGSPVDPPGTGPSGNGPVDTPVDSPSTNPSGSGPGAGSEGGSGSDSGSDAGLRGSNGDVSSIGDDSPGPNIDPNARQEFNNEMQRLNDQAEREEALQQAKEHAQEKTQLDPIQEDPPVDADGNPIETAPDTTTGEAVVGEDGVTVVYENAADQAAAPVGGEAGEAGAASGKGAVGAAGGEGAAAGGEGTAAASGGAEVAEAGAGAAEADATGVEVVEVGGAAAGAAAGEAGAVGVDIAGAAGVATAGEVGAETALIGAGAGLAGVVGTTALVGGVVLAAAGVVFGALCIFHAISICKKKVCTDPEGRWHSHSSHCTGGCTDQNGHWHRHQKHCEPKKCQGPDGEWHDKEDHCNVWGCHDPNGEWHKHQHNCDASHWKCKDSGGRWRAHKKHCKRNNIVRRDAELDEMSLDNSYIVITNAASFKNIDLDVMKGMVIMRDEDDLSNHASFEVGENFYAEGKATQVNIVNHSSIWAGHFTFPHPNPSANNAAVEGKWVSVTPGSQDPEAQQILQEIQAKNQEARNQQ